MLLSLVALGRYRLREHDLVPENSR
jgi:hypothetical protein